MPPWVLVDCGHVSRLVDDCWLIVYTVPFLVAVCLSCFAVFALFLKPFSSYHSLLVVSAIILVTLEMRHCWELLLHDCCIVTTCHSAEMRRSTSEFQARRGDELRMFVEPCIVCVLYELWRRSNKDSDFRMAIWFEADHVKRRWYRDETLSSEFAMDCCNQISKTYPRQNIPITCSQNNLAGDCSKVVHFLLQGTEVVSLQHPAAYNDYIHPFGVCITIIHLVGRSIIERIACIYNLFWSAPRLWAATRLPVQNLICRVLRPWNSR